jgi:hypothetical protein
LTFRLKKQSPLIEKNLHAWADMAAAQAHKLVEVSHIGSPPGAYWHG